MIVCTNYPGQTPTAYQNPDATDPDTAPTFVPASISTFLTWFPNEMRLRWLCSPADPFCSDVLQTLCPMPDKSDRWSSPPRENQGKEKDFQELLPLSDSGHWDRSLKKFFPSCKRIQLRNLILNAL